MARIKIDFDDSEVKKALSEFRKMPELVSKSYNKSLRQIKTPTAEIIYRYYTYPLSEIKKYVKVSNSKVIGSKISGGKLYSQSTRRPNLISFEGTSFTKTGIRYEIQRKRVKLDHGFQIKNYKSKAIFQRARRGGSRVARYPIVPKQGISIPVMLENERIEKAIIAALDSNNFKNLDYFTKKQYRRYLKSL